MMPTGPGWWWVSVQDDAPEVVRVDVRRVRIAGQWENDGLQVPDHDGEDTEWSGFRWLAPVLTPAETTALTARAERAERERDEARRWAEAAAADENANAAELRAARATLDAIAALVGPGDVVERVRALLVRPIRGGPDYVPALCAAVVYWAQEGDARPCGKHAVCLRDGAYYCEDHR